MNKLIKADIDNFRFKIFNDADTEVRNAIPIEQTQYSFLYIAVTNQTRLLLYGAVSRQTKEKVLTKW